MRFVWRRIDPGKRMMVGGGGRGGMAMGRGGRYNGGRANSGGRPQRN